MNYNHNSASGCSQIRTLLGFSNPGRSQNPKFRSFQGKMSLAKNNVINVMNLPPGFRFYPTDEELFVHYLRPKSLSRPVPAKIIPEFDVLKSDPWKLPGDSEEERYFFGTREAKYPTGNRSNRATCSGYWKATGTDKKVSGSEGNEVLGTKKTLVFYRGKAPNGARTDWVMHEYRLEGSDKTETPLENWVICRVFLKKRGTKNGEEYQTSDNGAIYYDFIKGSTDLNIAPTESFSGSSGITEASGNGSDHEESSSSKIKSC